MAKQRLVKIVTKTSNSDDSDQAASSHHEYIAGVDESTDDDGSITYVEDYEINENGDDDGAFFVEYITEEDNQMESNDTNELDGKPLSEYDDIDETTDELYNCNLCGMNFKSITDHIEKYHSGQDVLIDISDEGGTTVKSEKPLELNDYQDNDDESGSLINADNVSMNDGEMIVYGEESLEHDNELMDEATDDDNLVFTETSEVYTYDDATGSLTRTDYTRPKAVANKSNVCINCFSCPEFFSEN